MQLNFIANTALASTSGRTLAVIDPSDGQPFDTLQRSNAQDMDHAVHAARQCLDAVWHKLNVAWVGYTAFMSVTNAYVVLNFSTEAWVSFKLWGYVFPLVFFIGQGIYIAPHLRGDEAEEAPKNEGTP